MAKFDRTFAVKKRFSGTKLLCWTQHKWFSCVLMEAFLQLIKLNRILFDCFILNFIGITAGDIMHDIAKYRDVAK